MNSGWDAASAAGLLTGLVFLLWALRRFLRWRSAPSRQGSGLEQHLRGTPIPQRPVVLQPQRLVLERRTLPTLPAAMLQLSARPAKQPLSATHAKPPASALPT